jgi:rRNA-processing protein FCF1
LKISEGFGRIKISGKKVDDALVYHVKKNGGIVATIDIGLKGKIKENGGTILSLANDRIILEPSKT